MKAGRILHDTLYAGPDLHDAAARSQVRSSVRVRGIRNAVAILAGVAGSRLRRRAPRFELIVASGDSPDGRTRLSVAYAGPGTNREWCLSNALAKYDVIERQAATEPGGLRLAWAGLKDRVDIRFTEDLPRAFWPEPERALVTMPAWVKQRIRILEDWRAQVNSLRRSTRQEAGRMLRKYRYVCTLSRQRQDYADFYEKLYVPYVTQRFGSMAHVVDPAAFLAECRRGVLLRLTHDKRLVGAALLRPVGRTMSVVWSGVDIDNDDLAIRGVTDSLDYFSLLYAHVTGNRWLDMGPSRPDLCDGILRYKSKWGARITPGLVPQAAITWSCTHGLAGELEFFRRHAFLARARNGLRAVMAIDGQDDVEPFLARVRTGLASGIRDYRVVVLKGAGAQLKEAVRKLDANLELLNAADFPDIMSAMNAG